MRKKVWIASVEDIDTEEKEVRNLGFLILLKKLILKFQIF